MGDAACNIGPGGAALSAYEFGNVVEGHDITLDTLPSSFAGDAHREIVLCSAAAEGDLVGYEPPPLLLSALQKRAKLGDGLDQRLAGYGLLFDAKQRLGRAVHERNSAVGIHAHDASGHAGQHGLHETASLV